METEEGRAGEGKWRVWVAALTVAAIEKHRRQRQQHDVKARRTKLAGRSDRKGTREKERE